MLFAECLNMYQITPLRYEQTYCVSIRDLNRNG